MNLLSLANIISRRLPLEIVLVILSHLPVQDIVRLVQDDSPYFDRLLLNHPFFNDRHLHVLLISDPLYSPVIQAQLIPGSKLPPIHALEQRMLCLPPNPAASSSSSMGASSSSSKATIHFSLCPQLQLSRFDYTKRQIEFKPPAAPVDGIAAEGKVKATAGCSSSSTSSNWVRPSIPAGVIGVAVILTQNNVVLKRSLHAVNPVRTPLFERSHGYFGGQLEFEHQSNDGITRVAKCTVGMDWFCC